MYEHFFGLREKPFKLVPDPEYLYLSPSHARALSLLAYALDQGNGFVLITGEVGTGKTTLCRCFLAGLSDEYRSAYIFNTQIESPQLLSAICHELEIEIAGGTNFQQMLNALNHYLMAQHQQDRTVVLLIDEAQNLSIENLEMVRLLSNLETTRHKLLHIVLVGQPELADKLETYALRQLSQRISLRSRLELLSAAETRTFIEHRLQVAGNGSAHLFSAGALRLIHRYARGIPRRINIAADRGLLMAYEDKKTIVACATARKAIHELTAAAKIPRRKNSWKTVAMGFAAFVILSAVFIVGVHLEWVGTTMRFRLAGNSRDALSKTDQKAPTIAVNSQTMKIPSAEPTVSEPPLPGVEITHMSVPNTPLAEADHAGSRPFMDMASRLESRISRLDALTRLLALWQQPAPHSGQLPELMADEQYFYAAALQYGLRLLTLHDDWPMVRRLNLPAIVAIKPAGREDAVFVTLESRRDEGVMLCPGNRKSQMVDPNRIPEVAEGEVYIFWFNALGSDTVISQSTRGEAVVQMKKLLRKIGYHHLPATQVFDPPTYHAIVDFQVSQGIKPDGLVGPVTKIMLNKAARATITPNLDRIDPDDGNGGSVGNKS